MFNRKDDEDENDSLSYLDELIEKSKDYEIPEEIEELAESIGGGWWNYRFLEIVQGSTKFYELHEVYYDGDGKPWAWSDVVKLWFTDKYLYYIQNYLKIHIHNKDILFHLYTQNLFHLHHSLFLKMYVRNVKEN